ncbi:MAG: SH3 domain-containing protein [Acidobacteriota bacterium]|nr:SH3 domain-containing protein [Blastocatellia bacterium]MDW8411651.1 SH3 domain-containing protein [Acidobacteriota bacterium]
MRKLFPIMLLLFSCITDKPDRPLEQAVVIFDKAKLLTSTALVTTSLRELKLGEEVEILERQTVNQREYVRVRYKPVGEDFLEGWLEGRQVLSKRLLSESRKLAEESSSIQVQARGRTKDKLKLRLSPSRDSEVLTLLPASTEVDILERVRTERIVDTGERRFDRWYKVRLGNEYLTRAGWLYADSVEIKAPEAIAALPGGSRRIAAWVPFGSVIDDQTGREEYHYIILDKFTFSRDEEIDFDRLYVVIWDNKIHGYGSIYVESGLRGIYPVDFNKQKGILVLKLIDKKTSQVVPVTYLLAKDPKTDRYYVKKIK